jgi:hypothetical protein
MEARLREDQGRPAPIVDCCTLYIQNNTMPDDATTLTVRIDSALKQAAENIAAERDEHSPR